ncbi:polynucleotide adenylyltransferase PcnB [Vulgatibacter incomptus]|uniref:Poly(A) polymerase I n=1 Tax=Vulgatibacter incomptus TaxID=1391653 RepID=A0A0K1P9J5_9BACT|nr:polynucleotide adenylyltransferase PcnB [Vulgatibacter incomptus]AKU89764.1 Poly(A) polymerase [Vulgatibacter incomptus]
MNEEPSRDKQEAEAHPRTESEALRRHSEPLAALTALDPFGPPPEIPFEQLDPDALKVIHRLRSHGHQAYLVGGCVRDLLLGLVPKDFDVATSAHPGEIRAIFRNCRLIGRRFRLAHVFFRGGKVIETATFRANPSEADSGAGGPGDLLITQDNVFGSAEQDARRRDFTINGLFYDVILGRVIDYVDGRADLEKRQIRTIGEPAVRMQEDPVRILRAVRFAAKAGLEIEAETWKSMCDYKGELARCAPPRVLEEIFRLLRSGHSHRCIELLHRLDGLKVLLPPLASFLEQSEDERSQALFGSLRLLDEVVRRGPLPDDSVLLSTLLVHLSQHELIKGRAGSADRARQATGAEVQNGAALANGVPSQEQPGVSGEARAEEADASGPDVLDELEALEERSNAEAPLPAEVEEGEAPQVPWSISASARSVDELLAELVRSARLPRRIAERSRLLLHAQRILSGERKRRGSPAKFLRQPYFADALLIYELYVVATGHGAESLARWKARTPETAAPVPREPARAEAVAEAVEAVAPVAPAETPGGRGRKRRRRGRAKDEVSVVEAAEAMAVAAMPTELSGPESLPPEAERRPPPGPASLLPF